MVQIIADTKSRQSQATGGMIPIPGGTIRMGSDRPILRGGLATNPPKACCVPENPRGGCEDQSDDPCQPKIRIPRRVLKGARICAHPVTAAATDQPLAP